MSRKACVLSMNILWGWGQAYGKLLTAYGDSEPCHIPVAGDKLHFINLQSHDSVSGGSYGAKFHQVAGILDGAHE